ncbi:class I SAM-dependent methyltransferase [Anaerolineales bacterium HSG24]|nr:class I SAM-dependent methyltransferase [Anaerolineales bacterium HSG24]
MNTISEKEKQTVEKAKQGFEIGLFAQNYSQIHSDEQHLTSLLDLCQFVNDKHYLDLGTGNGYIAFEMAKQTPDIFVTGIDIVAKAIEVNNQKAKNYNRLKFIVYQGLELPFDDHEFFGVISRYAFHHFPNPNLAAKEISRIVQEDGFCIIADPTPIKLDNAEFINQFASLKDDGHVRFHTKEEIESIFGEAGFRVEGQIISSVTFPREMNMEYKRLVEQTSPDILEAYQVQIEKSQIYVTIEVLNTCFRHD